MSEIFVDTIRKTGGSLGTDIRIKNTSVYESDGGTSVTQNAVQGMLKCWSTVEMDNSNNVPDSFNNSSITDSSTGTPHFHFTNNFASAATYVFAGAAEDDSFLSEQGSRTDARSDSLQTGKIQTRNRGHNQAVNDGHHIIMLAGDLA